MDEFDDQVVDAYVSGEEVGADEVWDAMAELADEVAGEEVGRLFRRRRNLSAGQKRRRRAAGAIFGGPFGMIAAGVKRAKEKKRRPGGNTGAPVSNPRSIITSDRRIEPIGLGTFDLVPVGGVAPALVDLVTRLQVPVQYTRLIVDAFAYAEDPQNPGVFDVPVAEGNAVALANLRIQRWLIGLDPVFRSTQPIPAGAYGPQRDGQVMMTEGASSGLDNTITMQSISPAYRIVGSVSAEAYTSRR
jgi:hypothetical protein